MIFSIYKTALRAQYFYKIICRMLFFDIKCIALVSIKKIVPFVIKPPKIP